MKNPARKKPRNPSLHRLSAVLLAFLLFLSGWAGQTVSAERMSDGFDPDTPLPAVYSTGILHASELYSKNSELVLEIPGVARLMTFYLAIERLTADELVPISLAAARYDMEESHSSQIILEAGDQIPLRFLLLKMLFENSDTAAMAIAEKISGSTSSFLEEMRKTAATLGMTKTSFFAVDIAKAEEEADLPDHITEAISRFDRYLQAEDQPALTLPEADLTVATAKTSLRDIARLMSALINNSRAQAILEITDELSQVTSGGMVQVVPMRSPATHFVTLSENRITAAYMLLSDRYSLLCSAGTTAGNIPVMTIAVSLRRSALSQPSLQLHTAIDGFYTRAPLTVQGEKYPGAPEKAANGELFDLVYLDTVDYIHPKADPFLQQKLEYQGNAPYPIPVQKGAMTGQVVFTLKDGIRIHVRVGSDRDILAKSNIVSRALQQMMRNPNLAYTIIVLMVLLGFALIFIIIREAARLRYWTRIQRMESAAREARSILFGSKSKNR